MIKFRLAFCFIFTFLLLSSSPLMAQWNRASSGYFPGIELTPEQMDKAQDLRLQFQKETISLRVDLQTRYLELRNLFSTESSQNLIDAANKKITLLQEQMETRFQDHQNDIKAILTGEQRVLFERLGGLGFGVSNGMGYGFAGDYGRGFGRGGGAGFGRRGGAGFGIGRGAGMGRGWGI
ncbi:MAG: hypothetical protein KAH12_08085, partial [Anaerolineales bacterium]|nr:hypothetical protein [Anaerolineales bacterium]